MPPMSLPVSPSVLLQFWFLLVHFSSFLGLLVSMVYEPQGDGHEICFTPWGLTS